MQFIYENIPVLILILNIAIIAFFSVVLIWRLKIEHSYGKKVQELLAIPEKSLKTTETKLKTLLEGSLIETEKMVKNTEKFKDELHTQMQNTISAITAKYAQNLSETANQAMITIIEQMNKLNKEGNLSAQKYIQTRVDEELKHLKEDIENYRKNEIAKIEKALSETIVTVLEQIVKRNITMKDHEQIIVDSLQKAKDQNIFGITGNSTPLPKNLIN